MSQVVASPTTNQGYNFACDWWSLGVTAFELKTGGQRPFEINPKTSVSSAIVLLEMSKNSMTWPSSWSPEFTKFVAGKDKNTPQFEQTVALKSLIFCRSFVFESGKAYNHFGHGQKDQINGQHEAESLDEQKVPTAFCT